MIRIDFYDNLIFEIMKHTAKIYQIEHIPTRTIYIGVTSNIEARIYKHKQTIKIGKHMNSLVQEHFNKYGPKSFRLTILDECPIEIMFEVEKAYIQHMAAYSNMYNTVHTNDKANNDFIERKLFYTIDEQESPFV